MVTCKAAKNEKAIVEGFRNDLIYNPLAKNV